MNDAKPIVHVRRHSFAVCRIRIFGYPICRGMRHLLELGPFHLSHGIQRSQCSERVAVRNDPRQEPRPEKAIGDPRPGRETASESATPATECSRFFPYVFDRFRQAEFDSKRMFGRLGLSVVKALVEAHGGTVQAQSEGGARSHVHGRICHSRDRGRCGKAGGGVRPASAEAWTPFAFFYAFFCTVMTLRR